MKLDEYIERDKTERNLFWRLSPGEVASLLDEAIGRLEAVTKERDDLFDDLIAWKNAEAETSERSK